MIDQRLSWHAHIELLMNGARKLYWIFKIHVAHKNVLKIYTSLAQSIISYCIPVWGGATKTKILELERAQRSLIKVMYFKPYRYAVPKCRFTHSQEIVYFIFRIKATHVS